MKISAAMRSAMKAETAISRHSFGAKPLKILMNHRCIAGWIHLVGGAVPMAAGAGSVGSCSIVLAAASWWEVAKGVGVFGLPVACFSIGVGARNYPSAFLAPLAPPPPIRGTGAVDLA